MVDAAPFRALRYDAAVAGPAAATSAPAYDDLERFAYARHRTASPYTVLELLASEAGATANPYRTAGAAFFRWLRTGVLVTDDQPAFYRYDIHELRHGAPAVVRGVLAAVAVGDGQLLAHEAVDPDRVAARLQRMTAVPADLAPLYAVHPPAGPALREILDAPPTRPPLAALTDEAGADHRVWAITDRDQLVEIQRSLAGRQALIADGHHRYAAAVAHRHADPERNRTLTFLVDGSTHAPELRAIHRVVTPWTPQAEQHLHAHFRFEAADPAAVTAALTDLPCTAVVFGLVRGDGTASLLRAHDDDRVRAILPTDRTTAWRELDAAVWDAMIRPLVTGAVDYRSDLPPSGDPLPIDAAVFVLRPPTISAVYDCAVAGDPMPAKSTWFRPKPRAGLVMRSLQSAP